MKIARQLRRLAALNVLVFSLSACSGYAAPSPASTEVEKSVSQQFKEAVQAINPEFTVQETDSLGKELGELIYLRRSDNCAARLFESWQSAWNSYTEDGFRGTWVLIFGMYKNHPVVLSTNAENTECPNELAEVVSYNDGNAPTSENQTWSATSANIETCLEIGIECLEDKWAIPVEYEVLEGSSFAPLVALGGDDPLCDVDWILDESADLVVGSCTTLDSAKIPITQAHSEREILRLAAYKGSDGPNFLVYGDGWVISSFELPVESASEIAARTGGKVFVPRNRQ